METTNDYWCHSCKKQFTLNPLPHSEVECTPLPITLGEFCKLTFCEKIEGDENDPRNLHIRSTGATNNPRRLPSLQSLLHP